MRQSNLRNATDMLTILLVFPLMVWLGWWGLPLAFVPGLLLNLAFDKEQP